MRKVYFYMAIVLLLCACSEVIDFELGRLSNQVVIYGRITNGYGENEVYVAETQGINVLPKPVEGAIVRVFDEDGNSEQYHAIAPGRYDLKNCEIVGVPGKSYYLEVSLPDGRIYRSAPEQMPEVVGRDTLTAEVDIETNLTGSGVEVLKNVVNIYRETTVDDPSVPHYFKWNVYEVYYVRETPVPRDPPATGCFITEKLNTQEIILHDGEKFPTANIQRQAVVARLIDESFVSKHYFSVTKMSITKDAHRYWSQVDAVANRVGSIFDQPPAPVAGNIRSVQNPEEQVLGYFEVTATDTTRIRLSLRDLPFFLFERCQLLPEMITDYSLISPECWNCDLMENSSRNGPHYFR